MRHVIAGIVAAIVSLALAGPVATAQTAQFCEEGQQPAFQFGLAALKAQLGPTMGEPVECEHLKPDGDSVQQTTTGLAFYRQGSNTPTFTNGAQHWALTPGGIASWTGDAVDPPVLAGAGIPPASMSIPKLGVDAGVVGVGDDPTGAMAAPSDPDTVAWYALGPGMGVVGNAVFAGHIDWGGRYRVFGRLSALGPGDTVLVVDQQGNRYNYAVEWSRWIGVDAFPIEEIFGQTGDRVVTLITCGGEFNPARREYLDRLVVRARAS